MNRAWFGLGAAALAFGAWSFARPVQTAPTRLEGSERPAWSPDGTRCAYRVRDRERRVALYVADVDEPESARLVSAETGADREVHLAAWAPDGSRIAYTADEDVDGVYELYTVRPDGGDRRKVSPALPEGRSVVWFAWAPDGSTLLYVADQDVNDRFDLYALPASGGDPARLSEAMPAESDVQTTSPALP